MHVQDEAPARRLSSGRAELDDFAAAWRAAAEETWQAYWTWCDAMPRDRRVAHAVYRAAADRAAAAANDYMRHAR